MSDQAQGPGWWQASDSKWYPPQPPAPPAKKSRGCLTAVGALVVLAVVIVVIAVAAGGKDNKDKSPTDSPSVTQSSGGGKFPPADDATITACAPDDSGFMQSTVHILNHSPKPSDYEVRVTFESADGKTKYDDGYAFTTGLASGQQTDQQAQGPENAPAGVVCKIAEVDRHEHVAS